MKQNILIIVLVFFSISIYAQKEDFEFEITKQIKTTSVKNQAKSGTCWSFATISFLEAELLRLYKKEYNLSEMFIVKNILHDKAIMHIRMRGENFFTAGGQAHDVLRTIKTKGIVLENHYSGLKKGEKYHNHEKLDTLTTNYLKKLVDKKYPELTCDWINDYDKILEKELGKIPEKIEFEGKEFVPQEFAKKIKLDVDNYIQLTSYTHHNYYNNFILEDRFNWSFGRYLNIPYDAFFNLIDYAIENGYTVCWNGDVSEKTFKFSDGYANLPNYEGKATPELRQKMFENHASTVDHLMHIVGTAKEKDGTKYYIIKNSWGTQNKYNGILYMSDTYLKLKTLSIVLHKDAIPKKLQKKIQNNKEKRLLNNW